VNDTVGRRAFVHGRVQGVWYRASTADRARALGVRGHARNLPDGTVEVIVAGPRQDVDALLAWLWEGPPLARVTRIEVESLDDAVTAGVAEGFRTG